VGQLRYAWDETEALSRATARVQRRVDGAFRPAGTAFFVTERELLTCAHVALHAADLQVTFYDTEGQRHTRPALIKQRHPDETEFVDPYPTPDVALLEVVGDVPAHTVAWLDDADPGDELWAFGYPKEYREDIALGNPARFARVGRAESAEEGGWVWSLKADRVRGGMSGAPLLDLRTGRVVGLVKRTRDPTQALGAYAVGMQDVFAVLPGLQAANAAANPSARAHALATVLWGTLLRQARASLADAETCAAVSDQLDLPPGASVDDVARALFLADLDTVAECARIVGNLSGVEPAVRLFEAAAICTSYEGEPWIAPAAAAELELQVERLATEKPELGRVLRMPSRLSELAKLYHRRGDRRRAWPPLLEATPFSHLTDPVTGLPEDFQTNLRMLAARNVKAGRLAAATLDERAAQEWERMRPHLLAQLQKSRAVALLTLERMDVTLVGALAAHCPIVFLVAGAEPVSADVAQHDAYQELALGIDDDRAERALSAYEWTLEMLG
jgi:hypothetical protein